MQLRFYAVVILHSNNVQRHRKQTKTTGSVWILKKNSHAMSLCTFNLVSCFKNEYNQASCVYFKKNMRFWQCKSDREHYSEHIPKHVDESWDLLPKRGHYAGVGRWHACWTQYVRHYGHWETRQDNNNQHFGNKNAFSEHLKLENKAEDFWAMSGLQELREIVV